MCRRPPRILVRGPGRAVAAIRALAAKRQAGQDGSDPAGADSDTGPEAAVRT
jgi:hypothetical protein